MTLPLRCRVLFFDFDGVLVESVDTKTRAFQELYAPFGEHVVRRVTEAHLQSGGVSRYAKIRRFHKEFLGKELSEEELSEWADRFSDRVEDAVVQAEEVPGAGAFLEWAQNRFVMHLISGTPEEELVRIVKKREMDRYFESIVGAPREKAEALARILRESGVPASACAMIGDSSTDWEAARANRVPFIGRGSDPAVFPGALAVLPDLTKLSECVREASE